MGALQWRRKDKDILFFGEGKLRRGHSTSSREALGTSMESALAFFLSSAGNSLTLKGIDVDLTKTGTATSCIGAQIKAGGTEGSGMCLVGVYGIAQNSGTGGRPVVTGYYAGGEFEVIVDDTVTIVDSHASIILDIGNNAPTNPGDPCYMLMNSWGTNKPTHLFRTIGNETIATTSGTKAFTTLAGDIQANHAVRIEVNGTDLWLLARNAIT